MSYGKLVEQSLYDVVDPELGINIVDLGLVYGVCSDENNNVIITMTLTTPGCPMHDSITNGVKHRVSQLEEVGEVEVNLVWEPEWSPSKMSDLAKELL
ncbi:iron-sulfur cluster assembly protein [Psychrobacillus psychrodurans]|uniref:metal-sulfur cluster assembly factor n=1 Tax=Psychrobacillus TaxID=1221880 RepID=UPI0008F3B288|nr:iron-sulfur cluster assembly protein [Psychrobacillus psychrodurans]MCK1997578.1 iron-sulfur cluster assembly protein [Psychrobacillus psychrodurans]MCZ8540538.1 iron-sulfur cluster assembly protein [Psychrobacillus psychrodurans]SFM68144.1 Metal-sulfur cluster biosynthetic enzyme [Psychrobacillus psychrodurans]